MKRYIFVTTEGITYAPWDDSIDGAPEVENCQMLGCALGKDQQDAEQNLFKENPWITEVGFTTDGVFGYELAEVIK